MAEKKKEKFEILLEDLKKDFKTAFDGISTLRDEMRRGFDDVKEQIGFVDDKVKFAAGQLGGKIDAVHSSLKNEIKVTASALKDELGTKIDQKMEEHMRIPRAV